MYVFHRAGHPSRSEQRDGDVLSAYVDSVAFATQTDCDTCRCILRAYHVNGMQLHQYWCDAYIAITHMHQIADGLFSVGRCSCGCAGSAVRLAWRFSLEHSSVKPRTWFSESLSCRLLASAVHDADQLN